LKTDTSDRDTDTTDSLTFFLHFPRFCKEIIEITGFTLLYWCFSLHLILYF
jgi:hypothetical protein